MTRAKKMRTDINKEAHKFIGQLPATPHKQKPIEPVEPVEPIEPVNGEETVTVTKKRVRQYGSYLKRGMKQHGSLNQSGI
jgi:hypothetical protein